MKALLVLVFTAVLVGCGGSDEQLLSGDQHLDCELAGGEVTPLFVENLVTGEQYITEECELPKNCRYATCKVGSENCPIICD